MTLKVPPGLSLVNAWKVQEETEVLLISKRPVGVILQRYREALDRPYFRQLACEIRLRKRIASGVTSSSSSSRMSSRACSRFMMRGGLRTLAEQVRLG